MDDRTAHILGFDTVREKLAEECASSLGAETAGELLPSPSRIEVIRRQRETQEAWDYLSRNGSGPLADFDDVRDELHKSRLGSVLHMDQLLHVAQTLRLSRLVRHNLMEDCARESLLYGYAGQLVSERNTEEEIFRCILSDDEMADNASPALYRIRRNIRNCHARIRDKLGALVRGAEANKYLQDNIITMRNDRYVLPVRSEFRGQVPGLIHDQSGSGATLFVEPMAVVEINNELKELTGLEREEILRILHLLTALVARCADAAVAAVESLAQLDFVFAKAKLSMGMKATPPVIGEKRIIRIKRGRHPQLDPETAVPIDMWLGENFTTLVITGPNTGGKTVSLKTLGLFSVMAQSGLHLPAEEGCVFPVLDAVHADIGDEQSIQQSLSTFSSHMTHIVRILREAGENTLVLLDELGAGTDPTEGAALAIAILERLKEKGALVAATTHYSEIKAYALTTEGVENGAVEFDVASLRPTFHLSIGIPGKSNAFSISSRLGLEEEIIARAREYLSQEQIRFEDVIQNAEYHKQLAEKERVLARQTAEEVEALRTQVQAERNRLEEQRARILREARDEAKQVVRRTKAEVEQLIAQLRKMKTVANSSAVDREIQQARDALRAAEGGLSDAPVLREASEDAPLTRVEPGQRVFVMGIDQEATVLTAPNTKGELSVQVGAMKMNALLSNLRELTKAEKKARRVQERRVSTLNVNTVPLSLDLRGMTAEESVMDAERYLDEAFRSGVGEVTIIHGKGMGVLRHAITDMLRRNKCVESFRGGKYGEGEGGVTIVKLKN